MRPGPPQALFSGLNLDNTELAIRFGCNAFESAQMAFFSIQSLLTNSGLKSFIHILPLAFSVALQYFYQNNFINYL